MTENHKETCLANKKIKSETDRKDDLIREKISILKSNHDKTGKKISKESGWGHTDSTLSKFMNDDVCLKGKNRKESLQKLSDYCDEIIFGSINSKLVNDIKHPLYFSLIKELEIKNANQNFLLNNVLGTYKFYTGSYLLPNNFAGIVIGYMKVYVHDQNCVIVEEYQKYSGTYGLGHYEEKYSGYMIRKSNKIYIVSSQTKRKEREDLKVIVFHKKIPGKKIKHLEGVIFGSSHNFGIFNSRIVMEKIGDESLFDKEKEKSRIISLEEIEAEKENPKFKHYMPLKILQQKPIQGDSVTFAW